MLQAPDCAERVLLYLEEKYPQDAPRIDPGRHHRADRIGTPRDVVAAGPELSCS